jgi:hypothetical protein
MLRYQCWRLGQQPFVAEDARQVSNIVFGVDTKWQDKVSMLVGNPLRETTMEFFPSDRVAKTRFSNQA